MFAELDSSLLFGDGEARQVLALALARGVQALEQALLAHWAVRSVPRGYLISGKDGVVLVVLR